MTEVLKPSADKITPLEPPSDEGAKSIDKKTPSCLGMAIYTVITATVLGFAFNGAYKATASAWEALNKDRRPLAPRAPLSSRDAEALHSDFTKALEACNRAREAYSASKGEEERQNLGRELDSLLYLYNSYELEVLAEVLGETPSQVIRDRNKLTDLYVQLMNR